MIYFSLDLDAFYCAVEEHYDPTLKGEPFCVYQKQVVATLSYEARKLGIKKLSNAQQVRKQFPTMRMVNGESLSRYRAAGILLVNWLREIVKSPIERLGLEEMRCEVSSQIEKAVTDLQLDNLDIDDLPDEVGDGLRIQLYDNTIHLPDFFFSFDGKTVPPGYNTFNKGCQNVDFYLAGHVARYIQEKMLLDLGYSCSIGVGSTISLAKIACGENKPAGVTVLWPGYEQTFMDRQPLRKVPGFGSRRIQNLAPFGLDSNSTIDELHSKINQSEFLEVAPAELYELSWCREKVDLVDWRLPSQVSVEETWPSCIIASEVPLEVEKLVDSLMSQVETDMVCDGVWQASPTHVRVSIIKYRETARQSRSQKLLIAPQSIEFPKVVLQIASRLAIELAKSPIRLINVALLFPS